MPSPPTRKTPIKVRAKREKFSIDDIPTRDTTEWEKDKLKNKRIATPETRCSKYLKPNHSSRDRKSLPETGSNPRQLHVVHVRSLSEENHQRQPEGGKLTPACKLSSAAKQAQRYISRNNSALFSDSEASDVQHSCLSRNIYRLWRNCELCDVIIHAGGQNFYVHRLVVATACERFAKTPNIPVMECYVPNVSAETMRQVTEYFYTNKISINEHNLKEIVEVSKQLGIKDIMDRCTAFLCNVNVSNTVNHLDIAYKYQLPSVVNKIKRYAQDHFGSLSSSEAFLRSDFKVIHDIIASELRVAVDELLLFNACARWIEYDMNERLGNAVTLMRLIKFCKIPTHELAAQVEKVPFMNKIPECKELLFTAYRHQALTLSERGVKPRSVIQNSHTSSPSALNSEGYEYVQQKSPLGTSDKTVTKSVIPQASPKGWSPVSLHGEPKKWRSVSPEFKRQSDDQVPDSSTLRKESEDLRHSSSSTLKTESKDSRLTSSTSLRSASKELRQVSSSNLKSESKDSNRASLTSLRSGSNGLGQVSSWNLKKKSKDSNIDSLTSLRSESKELGKISSSNLGSEPKDSNRASSTSLKSGSKELVQTSSTNLNSASKSSKLASSTTLRSKSKERVESSSSFKDPRPSSSFIQTGEPGTERPSSGESKQNKPASSRSSSDSGSGRTGHGSRHDERGSGSDSAPEKSADLDTTVTSAKEEPDKRKSVTAQSSGNKIKTTLQSFAESVLKIHLSKEDAADLKRKPSKVSGSKITREDLVTDFPEAEEPAIKRLSSRGELLKNFCSYDVHPPERKKSQFSDLSVAEDFPQGRQSHLSTASAASHVRSRPSLRSSTGERSSHALKVRSTENVKEASSASSLEGRKSRSSVTSRSGLSRNSVSRYSQTTTSMGGRGSSKSSSSESELMKAVSRVSKSGDMTGNSCYSFRKYKKNHQESRAPVCYSNQRHKESTLSLSPINSDRSKTPPEVPRKPQPTLRFIMVMGGINPYHDCHTVSQESNSVQQYDPEFNTWSIRTHLPKAVHHFAVTEMQGKIFVMGGQMSHSEDVSPLKECHCYDVRADRWHTISGLKTARSHHAAVHIRDSVYALGGEDCVQMSLKSLEVYDIRKDSWEFLTPMKDSRSGLAAIAHRRRIFVVGGVLDIDEKFLLDSVEVYDPKTDQWSFRFPLPISICNTSLAEVDGVIFMVGGYIMKDKEPLSLDSIFRYCDETDTWEGFHTLHVPRHNAITAALVDLLYVIGGESSAAMGHALSNVECLNVKNDRHITGIAPLLAPAYGIAGCVFESRTR